MADVKHVTVYLIAGRLGLTYWCRQNVERLQLTHRHIHRDTQTYTQRHTDIYTETQRHIHRDTETYTQRHTDIYTETHLLLNTRFILSDTQNPSCNTYIPPHGTSLAVCRGRPSSLPVTHTHTHSSQHSPDQLCHYTTRTRSTS